MVEQKEGGAGRAPFFSSLKREEAYDAGKAANTHLVMALERKIEKKKKGEKGVLNSPDISIWTAERG